MKIIKLLLKIGIIGFVLVLVINAIIVINTKKQIYYAVNDAPEAYTAIVLGAYVSKSGYLSGILQDRVDTAVELYKNKKVQRFLLSGDHGRSEYDEVNSMRNYLLKKGIKTEDIFLDHAGFDTYSSIVRANKIFKVNEALIVTQKFHLPRALYIANRKGLKATGVVADKNYYPAIKRLKAREFLANIKAFIEISIRKKPKYLGSEIPITGNSALSYD